MPASTHISQRTRFPSIHGTSAIRYVLPFLALGLLGMVTPMPSSGSTISFTSTETTNPGIFNPTTTTGLTWSSTIDPFDPSGFSYDTSVTYPALPQGSRMRFYKSGNLYGPYGSESDEWGDLAWEAGDTSYDYLPLLVNSNGGSIYITGSQVTSVVYETPDTYFDTLITYGALESGTRLWIYTTDSTSMNGTWASSDNWSSPEDKGGYAEITLTGATTGDRVAVISDTVVTSVVNAGVSAVPEPSTYALLASGLCAAAVAAGRRRVRNSAQHKPASETATLLGDMAAR